MKRLRILTVILIGLAYLVYTYKQSIEAPSTVLYSELIPSEWFETKGEILTPKKDRRKADQTFLTFPEWFLVFSPEEQAAFFETNTATNYPYRSQVNQFWDSYDMLQTKMNGKFPYNDDYHMMVQVIGASTELEYDMKSWYETVIGRTTQTATMTDEDRFTQRYTAEYAEFLNTAAWYDFDYNDQLKKLWSENSFFGWNMHRKLERKYLLTSEILLKITYAELIKMGTKSMYGGSVPAPTTVVVTDSLTDLMKSDETIDWISSTENGLHVLRIPRYTPFMETAKRISMQGANFVEVAGNKSAILISLVVDSDMKFDKNKTRVLFAQSIALNPNLSRMVVVTPVAHLAEFIRYCEQRELQIEHIYDF